MGPTAHDAADACPACGAETRDLVADAHDADGARGLVAVKQGGLAADAVVFVAVPRS